MLLLWLLYAVTVGLVLKTLILLHRKQIASEFFNGDAGAVDDLQGSKSLGIRINGTRQLTIEPGGLRFSPKGSALNQSLLQDYEYTTVNVGRWLMGGATFTGLSPVVLVQRVGRLVSVQVKSIGAVTFGASPAAVTTIESEVPLPSHMRPPDFQPNTLVVDQSNRKNKVLTFAFCVASIRTDGKIQIERYNMGTFGGNKATLALDSFVIEYVL
jgi:hypothetical protein